MNEPIDTIEYRGYTININQDLYDPNPWEDWDGQPPMIVLNLERSTMYSKSYGNVDFKYVPELTEQEIRANIPQIKTLLSLDNADSEYKLLLHAVRDAAPDYLSDYVNAHEAVNDTLNNIYGYLSASDKLEMQSQVYDIKGIPNLLTTKHGYGQGDYVHLLLVATPEWIKEVGIAEKDITRSLENDAQLYADWCFGNVYGFEILDKNGEPFDSVWGFYGNPDESGCISDAKTIIDWTIKGGREDHFRQVKTWIKSHTPLIYRQPLEV